MIGTRVLSQEEYVIKVITTEDGQRFVNLNDLYQFLPRLGLIENRQEKLSEDNLCIGLKYISDFLIEYDNLKLYSTTKHHGVKFLPLNTARKDTLFYILEENQSYLTLAIKKTLIQSNIVKFANYTRVRKKLEAEKNKYLLSLPEHLEGEPNLHIDYDWELLKNDYFIHPYYREEFIEDLYRFIIPLIGEDCVKSWENSNRLLEISRKKSVKEMFLDGSNKGFFSYQEPDFFLPVLNKECNLKICQKRTELRDKFLTELYTEIPNHEQITIGQLEQQASDLRNYFYHYNMENGQYDIPILAEYESFPSYQMFFTEEEKKGYIFKVYQQKMYRDTLTLRPTTEEHFKHIIDYLFEDAVDKYLDSYNTK